MSNSASRSRLHDAGLDTARSPRPSSIAVPLHDIAGGQPSTCARLEVVCLADIAPAPIDWLWHGRLAIGKISVLAGEGGVGKSLAAMSIAATVTVGGAWPCGEGHAGAGNVVLLSSEEGLGDALRPRITAAGGDPERVDVVHVLPVTDSRGRRAFDLSRDLAALEALILARGGVRLVIIDSVGGYFGRRRRDEYQVLEAIAGLADRRRVAVLLIAPPRKGRSILARYGTGGFVAASFALVADAKNAGRRLLLPVTHKLTESIPALAFGFAARQVGLVRAAPFIVWETEALSPPVAEAMRHATKSEMARRTAFFLHDLLSDGSLPARDIEAKAVAAGLLVPGQPLADSRRFRDARAALRIASERIADGWAWRLPQAAGRMTH